MTLWQAVIFIGPPCFWLGWMSNTWCKRLRARLRERGTGVSWRKIMDHAIPISVVLLAFTMIGSMIYQHYREDARDARETARDAKIERLQTEAVENNTFYTSCMKDLNKAYLEGTQVRSDAAGKKDQAFIDAFNALEDMITLRVDKQIDNSPDVAKTSEEFHAAVAEARTQFDAFVKAKEEQPIPDYDAFCMKTQKNVEKYLDPR